MSRHSIVYGIFLFLFLPAAAQENLYSGKWIVEATVPPNIDLPHGLSYVADVVIEGQTGWWQARLHDKYNRCIGLRAPLFVTQMDSDQLIVRVKESAVLQGCTDYTARFKKIDESKLQGNLGRQSLIATRQ